jgi:hypothetical protein
MTDPRGEAVRKELIEFLLATKATVERGPGAEYDARVLLLTVEDRCSAGAEYPHAEEWTFDVTEIDELIGLLSATAPQPVTIGAAAAGVGSSADLPQPALLPRHLVRRGMRPDGTFPQSDNDEPEVEDAICEAHNILNCDMCRAPRPASAPKPRPKSEPGIPRNEWEILYWDVLKQFADKLCAALPLHPCFTVMLDRKNSGTVADILILIETLGDYLREQSALSEKPARQASFEAWLCREMPEGTVIGDPKWWAPRTTRAFARSETPAGGTAKVPEGWRELMLKALEGVDEFWIKSDEGKGWKRRVYLMLAAAPSPDGSPAEFKEGRLMASDSYRAKA